MEWSTSILLDHRLDGHVAEQRDLARISSVIGFSVRQIRMSGWMPISRSLPTECWVGLVLISPRRAQVRQERQVDEEHVAPASTLENWRIASRNGRPSMSPTVPPISVIATSRHRRSAPRGSRP
jgi:hypothetical protein